MFPKGGGPIPPGKGPDPASDLTQAYLFLQPLTTPAKGQSYSTTPPVPVPQFDFHQAVSLLGRHPALLRLSGSSTSSSSRARAGSPVPSQCRCSQAGSR